MTTHNGILCEGGKMNYKHLYWIITLTFIISFIFGFVFGYENGKRDMGIVNQYVEESQDFIYKCNTYQKPFYYCNNTLAFHNITGQYCNNKIVCQNTLRSNVINEKQEGK